MINKLLFFILFSSLLIGESYEIQAVEIEKEQSCYSKNEEHENSIMSHERRGRITNLFANKAFYIPSPKPNGASKIPTMKKRNLIRTEDDAFD